MRPFTDKQIELVTNFASQAVIAIENVRLLTELRASTDELGQSVEELRALGEVTQAVNSTLDLQTVLSTIVTKAVELSATEAGSIYVADPTTREFRSARDPRHERRADCRAQAARASGSARRRSRTRRRIGRPVQFADLTDPGAARPG